MMRNKPDLTHSKGLTSSNSTPLNYSELQKALQAHPNQVFVQFLLRGMQEGFRIGCVQSKQLRSAAHNMHSTQLHPEVLSQYLAEEIAEGRVIGPFSVEIAKASAWYINRFGVIPKQHNPGHWRLIVDLSFPPGTSVNDDIDPALCSLKYTKVEEVANVIVQLGAGTKLAKADIKAAYRLVPVHPCDRPLLAMQWKEDVYMILHCHLAYGRHQNYSMRWQMHWNGA